MDELQLLQHQISLQQRGGVGTNNPNAFSDLTTFNASMSRKRPPPAAAVAAAASLPDSSVTSTSGTVLAIPAAPPSHNLVALLRQKDLEIDAIVRLHMERLRNEVREVTKRHCQGLLSAAEREAARRLREKAAELEVARLTNAALEEKVRQLSAENQMRLAAAKHHEAAVGVLRGSLQRALLLQQSSSAGAGCREGYGDSEAVVSAAESSCCFEAEEKGRGRKLQRSGWWCKACGRQEARTLLLPCKHLCLCEECEPAVGECPVCGAAKTAGFQGWYGAARKMEAEKKKAAMAEDSDVDELLAALGYKVRSSNMADIAQKLELAEMAMGSSATADDDALFCHLADDTVHYNPSDISTWVDNVLSELNAPPPVPSSPLKSTAPLDQQRRHHEGLPSEAEQSSVTTVVLPLSTRRPAQVYDLEPLPAVNVARARGRFAYSSDPQMDVVDPAPRDSKRIKFCGSPPSSSSSSTADAATSTASNLPGVVVDTQEAGIRLVHALLACAEALEQGNLQAADTLMKQITVLAASQGGAMRKVAAYFAEALGRRIYRPPPLGGVVGCPSFDSVAFDDMLHAHFYESCPYLKFAHFTANQAILEAFAGFRRVHVIDFGMRQGLQWPAVLQALALRPGGPPSFRLTGIGPPQPDNSDALQEVGWKLAQFAETIRVDFRYRGFVASSLADLEPAMLLGKNSDDCGGAENEETEVVAVNSVLELHRLLARPGALEKVLGTIRAVRPRIVTVVEQEANHNGGTFRERFTEALRYYSTMFDSLEGGGKSGGGRDQVMSELYLGRQICNVVACEGVERRERHEAVEQWRGRLVGAGFESVPIGSNAFKQASMLLALFAGGDGYRVEEKDGCLTLGWHTRPLIAASAWRVSSAAAATAAVPRSSR